MNFSRLSFRTFPYDNNLWSFSLGDLNIFLHARNGFLTNCRESFLLELRCSKIRLLITWMKYLKRCCNHSGINKKHSLEFLSLKDPNKRDLIQPKYLKKPYENTKHLPFPSLFASSLLETLVILWFVLN